jgi:hypothetical protein
MLLRVISRTSSLAFAELWKLELEVAALGSFIAVVAVGEATTTVVLGVGTTPRIALWWPGRRRAAVRVRIAWSIVIIVVWIIGVVAIITIIPVKHAFALLEVVGDMVYALLSWCKAVLAKAATPRELGLRTDDTGFFVSVAADTWMDIPEMLSKVILPKTWLHVLNTCCCAEAANPWFAGVAFLFVSLPVALPSIALATLSCTLVDLAGVSAE